MKQKMKLLLAAFFMTATVSLVSCSKDEEEKTTYEASTTFDIIYEGQTIAAGGTIEYTLGAEEFDGEVSLYVKNKSSNTVQRVFQVELVEGPATMANAPICYGQCTEQHLTYISEPVAIAAGATDNQAIQIHLWPDMHGDAHTGTYKVTVGIGANLEDPQVCFVKFNW